MFFFLSLNYNYAYFLFQPCFAEVEFPESNFVDQVELLLKDPEEKEKFFQVCNFFQAVGFVLLGWKSNIFGL